MLPEFYTIFMHEFSLNVLGKSVPISMATISTAWFCRLCFFTNSSLHKMAAADPSDVGLNKKIHSNTAHVCAYMCFIVFYKCCVKYHIICFSLWKQNSFFHIILFVQVVFIKNSLFQTYQHCNLVRGSWILGEAMICSKEYSSWNWEYLSK